MPCDGQLGWSHAEQGQCEYCGEHTLTRPDPFGQKPACRPCWEQIAWGEE